MADVQNKIQTIRAQLRSAFISRAQVSDGIIIAMLAEENVLMVGPPGTAKSALARVLCDSITSAKFFTCLLGKTTAPEDLFGMIDPREFQNGRYVRRVERHMPAADIVHLDEVFRGSAAILDTTLKLINERKFDNDGQEVDCPLKLLVGTTNSVPDTAELAAFYDRFALRFYVGHLKSQRDRTRLLKLKGEPSITATLTLDELKQAIAETKAVVVSEQVMQSMVAIWQKLEDEGVMVSERTWRKIMKLAKARAYLDGRSEVAVDDLDIIADSAWHEPTERSTILRTVINTASPMAAKAVEALDAAQALVDGVPTVNGTNHRDVAVAGSDARMKIERLTADLAEFKAGANPSEVPRIESIEQQLASMHEEVARRMLEIARMS